MTADPPTEAAPEQPVAPTAKQAARLQREAEALRQNLQRRKQQSRARQLPDPDAER